MAIKKYISKITGTHALTGRDLVEGQEYDVEESLAGPEIFEEIKPKKKSVKEKEE